MSDSHAKPPASSPCYADDQARSPYTEAELIELLNELLESERAGARGLNDLSKQQSSPEMQTLMLALAKDEGRFCVMLRTHVQRLGGTPSDATGAFYEKLLAREGLAAQMSLLDRGQSAVVDMLTEMLPRLRDDALLTDLQEMRAVHIDNIEAANQQAAAFLQD